jgi:hypothetical protein
MPHQDAEHTYSPKISFWAIYIICTFLGTLFLPPISFIITGEPFINIPFSMLIGEIFNAVDILMEFCNFDVPNFFYFLLSILLFVLLFFIIVNNSLHNYRCFKLSMIALSICIVPIKYISPNLLNMTSLAFFSN